MQNQDTNQTTTQNQQPNKKLPYSKPQITILGTVNKLTLANEAGDCLDNVVPGGQTTHCPS